MSTAQLRAFHVVALVGGFSRAAREMGLSQSSLSGQVRQLEASSGVALFDRHPSGVELTADGRALFEVTTRLFAAEAEARSFLRRGREHSGGHLRIAADGAVHSASILAEVRRQRPELTFSLAIGNSHEVIEQLVNQRADVGITARAPDDARLHARPMLAMGVGVFVPADHDWAERSRISTGELAGKTFVLRERGSVTRAVFEEILSDHGVVLGSVVEVSSTEGVREMVAAGFGLGIVADCEFGHDPRLRYLTIADTRRAIQEYAVCPDEHRRLPLVRAFLDHAVAFRTAR